MRKKTVCLLLCLLLLLLSACGGAELESVAPGDAAVTLSIRCDDILAHYAELDESLRSEEFVPTDGVILAPMQVKLRKDDTVFDILLRVLQAKKIAFEYQGSADSAFGTAYVRSIQCISEFSCGAASGWVYTVNGERQSLGSSQVSVKNGDKIVWQFVCTGFGE